MDRPPISTVSTGTKRLYKYVRSPSKRIVAELLYERQSGECGMAGPAMACDKGPLEIDHVDGDPNNWAPNNLRLLCHAHNIAERNRQRSASVCEKPESDATEALHRSVDYTRGSAEMEVTDAAETPFRNYVEARLRNLRQPVPRKALQDDGAEVFGVSIATTDRYLRKLCSGEGRFRVTKPPRGPRVVWFRVLPSDISDRTDTA